MRTHVPETKTTFSFHLNWPQPPPGFLFARVFRQFWHVSIRRSENAAAARGRFCRADRIAPETIGLEIDSRAGSKNHFCGARLMYFLFFACANRMATEAARTLESKEAEPEKANKMSHCASCD